jgi:hypothetical protein
VTTYQHHGWKNKPCSAAHLAEISVVCAKCRVIPRDNRIVDVTVILRRFEILELTLGASADAYRFRRCESEEAGGQVVFARDEGQLDVEICD